MSFGCILSNNCDNKFLFQRETYKESEYFVDMPGIGVWFMSEILSKLHFGFFHSEGCGF